MANAVATLNASVPAAIRNMLAKTGAETFNELAGGVLSSFPIISYRGKVWRIKKGGEEHDVVDDEGDPLPSIEVAVVKSNPLPSKIFYENDYVEGSNEAPNCWSADGVKPDKGVQQPVCKTCAACPNNVWGSKITKQGKKTKACADMRRMAVVSKQELEEHGEKAPIYLLRVPPASLNPLKDYAEKVLKPKGIPYFSVITKVSFETEMSYPQLKFAAKRFLSDDEAAAVLKLRDSEDARRILAESEEIVGAGTTEGSEASPDGDEANPSAPAAPAPAKKKGPPKARPAEEEDVGLDAEPTPPPKKKAAAPVVVEEEEEEIAPPPPKKKAAAAPAVEEVEEQPAPPPKKKAAAPVVEEEPAPPPKKKAAAAVVNEEEEQPAPPPKKKAAAAPPPADEDEEPAPPPAKKKAAAAAGGDEFESMLDSILES